MTIRRILSIALALAALLLTGPVQAQEVGPEHADPYWQASYWNNMTLAGPPVVEEQVERLGDDWLYGSPHPSVHSDQFSARWSRYIDLAEATYRFSVTSDDGVRVYLDNRLIIDRWTDHPAQTFTRDLDLQAGHHHIVVEYYEHTGIAKVGLAWWPLPTGTGLWQREFYDNPTLSGSPVGLRVDDKIEFDWGEGKVGPGGPTDHFSMRWTGSFGFQPGRYRFTATADDGIRAYVDGRLIVNAWRDQPASTYSAELDLGAGIHQLVVEYYERTGAALVAFSWRRLSADGEWQAEYYDNPWLRGRPALIRNEQGASGGPGLDFDWGYGSPAPQIPGDNFAARWTRTDRLPAGLYRFTATTDDGVRLWVNGHLLIDEWTDQAAQSHSGTIHVPGDVQIKMEYYEKGGVASARLTWVRLDGTSPGEVIVDDGDPGFVPGGSPTAWHKAQDGYGGDLLWTQNNDRARPNYNWVRWYPNLQPGRYGVYVYVPERQATTSNARYWIVHRDGLTLRQVDQAATRGRWVLLGVYQFDGDKGDYVSLADVTYEPYLSTQIGFDAVKWVPR